jgi:hypothetical protein
MHNRYLPEKLNQINTLIFAVLFVLTGIVSIFLFASGWILTNPERYKEALWESGFYPRVPSIAAEQTASFFNNESCQVDPKSCSDYYPFYEGDEIPPFLKDLPENVWVNIFSEILTSKWAQEQSERILDQYFSYLNGELSNFSVEISLEYPKERLRGEPGERVFHYILSAQSPCSAEILLRMVSAALQGASLEALPLCRIPEEFTGHFSLQINQIMEIVAASFPDQINIGEDQTPPVVESNPQPGPQLVNLSEFSDFRKLTLFSPLAPLTMAFLVVIFGVRSLKGLLLWLGLPLIFIGLLTTFFSVPLTSTISSLIATYFFRLHDVHYPNLLMAGYEASNYLAGVVSSFSQTAGIALAVAGFLMSALSLVFPSRQG